MGKSVCDEKAEKSAISKFQNGSQITMKKKGSDEHQFLSGTLHWFAIRDNVSISPITAEQPVGQQSGCWARARRAWQRFNTLIAAVQLCVGLAVGHTISTVIDWRGGHEEKQQDGVSPTKPRGRGSGLLSTFCAEGMLQTLALKRRFASNHPPKNRTEDGTRRASCSRSLDIFSPLPPFDPAYCHSLTVEEKKKSRQQGAENRRRKMNLG